MMLVPNQLDLFSSAAHLTRIEPAANMRRYYSLQIAPDLFGGYALTRSWGRIGLSSAMRIELYEDEAAAIGALQVWYDQKVRRGYV